MSPRNLLTQPSGRFLTVSWKITLFLDRLHRTRPRVILPPHTAMTHLPDQIAAAMQQGYWKDPGPGRLARILDVESADPLILLSREKMKSPKTR